MLDALRRLLRIQEKMRDVTEGEVRNALTEEGDSLLAKLWKNPEDAAAYDDPEDMLGSSLEDLEEWEAEHGETRTVGADTTYTWTARMS